MLKHLCGAALALSIVAPALAQPPASGQPSGRAADDNYRSLLYDSRGMITPYPLNEQRLPNRFWREGYRLTPREYNRLRKSGFTQQEVYLIANAARDTGLDPGIFANAIYRGLYARQISYEYSINQRRLIRVLPEWRTAAWAAATGEEAIKRDTLNVWW